MRLTSPSKIILATFGVVLLGILAYQFPPINNRLSWRLDAAQAYLRGVIQPVQAIPTPLPQPVVRTNNNPPPPSPTSTPNSTATPGPTPTPRPSPTPIPRSTSLNPPSWEKQDWNNCGPATLAQYLRFYGWEGDQFSISDLLKPERADRNVNVEELTYYVRTRAGWLNAEFRVGGTIDILKQFLAAGIPVMVEEGFYLDTNYWPNDDRWAGHYLLLTGYDDGTQSFTGQDSFIGADQTVSYQALEAGWQAFNKVYILIYLPTQEAQVKEILGPHWDVDYNREQALQTSQAAVARDPQDAFGWFNLGTNLIYFERYREAAQAYDRARNLGLPQRMLRYQFGPFFAYFHSGRTDDLITLTEYALQRTPNSEEALLWHGWGLYRQGDNVGARADFYTALEANPYHLDAQYALDFLNTNP